jgi:hypothetical protein
LLRDMVLTQHRSPAKAKTAKKLKKIKAKPARPTKIQKQNQTQKQKQQQNGQMLVYGTAGHSDGSTLTQSQYAQQLVDETASHSTPTQQCGEQLVEDGTAGGGHSEDSSMSTWSSCWGEELLGFDEDDYVDSFRMDSSEEDYLLNIFGMDSSLHATSLTRSTSAAAAECCNAGVPSLLFIPTSY